MLACRTRAVRLRMRADARRPVSLERRVRTAIARPVIAPLSNVATSAVARAASALLPRPATRTGSAREAAVHAMASSVSRARLASRLRGFADARRRRASATKSATAAVAALAPWAKCSAAATASIPRSILRIAEAAATGVPAEQGASMAGASCPTLERRAPTLGQPLVSLPRCSVWRTAGSAPIRTLCR